MKNELKTKSGRYFRMLNSTKRAYLIGGAAIVTLVILYFATLSPTRETGELTAVTQGDIIQEVLLTGAVKAAESATLSFDRSGKIKTFQKQTGAVIPDGAVIATLESGAEQAAVAEAESRVVSAEIALREIKRGARTEELRVKEADVLKTETALQNLLEKTETIIADAYNETDIALNRRVDPLFLNDESQAPRLSFSSGNQGGVYQAEVERITAGGKLQELKTELNKNSGEETRLTKSVEDIRAIHALFLTLSGVLTGASGLGETALADYKERVGTAQTNTADAIASLQNHVGAIRDAKAANEKAKRELELTKAGSTKESIEKAEQTLLESRARLASANAALQKTMLRAPFSGAISARKSEIGETVSAGTAIASFIGSSGFVIEAPVPEADVTKIKIGDPVEITLDAYGNDVILKARAAEIEPGEILIDGVPTYKATFVFLDKDERPRYTEGFGEASPRSGMTANITLKKTLKENALLIPLKTVIEKNGKKFVRVKETDKKNALREITTGARGEGGVIELLAGATAGEKLLIPKKE